MPQPDRSRSPARRVARAGSLLAGLICVAAAGLSFYNGGPLGVIAGVTALAVLLPLAMLFLSVRSTQDETQVARSAHGGAEARGRTQPGGHPAPAG